MADAKEIATHMELDVFFFRIYIYIYAIYNAFSYSACSSHEILPSISVLIINYDIFIICVAYSHQWQINAYQQYKQVKTNEFHKNLKQQYQPNQITQDAKIRCWFS